MRSGRRVTMNVETENPYLHLLLAVLIQANRDMKRAAHRAAAEQWLNSSRARAYAELAGVDPAKLQNLLAN